MTRTASTIVALSLLVAVSGEARVMNSYEEGPHHDWARVVSSTPIYETTRVVTPVRECWTERVRYERPSRPHRSYVPTLVGATIGGVIGHELGHKKRGRRIAAAVGALLGGSIAHDIHQNHHPRHGPHRRRRVEYHDEERCEVQERVEYEQHVVGYDVEYRFDGRMYRARLDHDPGSRIEVAYDVTPWE